MLIKVVSLEGPVRAEKGYRTLTVNYDADGKTKSQRLVDFGVTKTAFEVLLNAGPGDVYEITLEKKGDYWNWVNAQASAAKETSKGGSSGSRSSFETPEERAQRQIYIIRQSSVANALTFHTGSKVVDIQKVLNTAEEIFQYVINGLPKGASKTTLTDDVPDWPK